MPYRMTFAALILLVSACGREQESAETTVDGTATASDAYVVELRAIGKTFEGPSTIPSGWTTFDLVNSSGMLHFALIDVPPEGITAREMDSEVMRPFQDAMDAMTAGDEEAVDAAFGRFPAWIAELGRAGGPGLVSAGLRSQATVYLEPGHYIVECYIKSDGVFHTTGPAPGQLGMMLDLTVTAEGNGAPEPTPNATLAIRNSGFELVSGELKPGSNTIRVDFVEQQALPSFVGNDVHVMRIDDADSVAAANAWMDWRTNDGLEDPGPVTFLGGINDLPAGAHGYFTVELARGDYAFIAEMPDPQANGFVLPFSVN